MKCPKCDTPLFLVETVVPTGGFISVDTGPAPTERPPTQQEPVQSVSEAARMASMGLGSDGKPFPPKGMQTTQPVGGKPRYSPAEWESKLQTRWTSKWGERVAQGSIKNCATDEHGMKVLCPASTCPTWDNRAKNTQREHEGKKRLPDFTCKGFGKGVKPEMRGDKPSWEVIQKPCESNGYPLGWWQNKQTGKSEWYDPDIGGEPYSNKGVSSEDVERAHAKEYTEAMSRDRIGEIATELAQEPTQAELDAQNVAAREAAMKDDPLPF